MAFIMCFLGFCGREVAESHRINKNKWIIAFKDKKNRLLLELAITSNVLSQNEKAPQNEKRRKAKNKKVLYGR